jgi:hypothetical protein
LVKIRSQKFDISVSVMGSTRRLDGVEELLQSVFVSAARIEPANNAVRRAKRPIGFVRPPGRSSLPRGRPEHRRISFTTRFKGRRIELAWYWNWLYRPPDKEACRLRMGTNSAWDFLPRKSLP